MGRVNGICVFSLFGRIIWLGVVSLFLISATGCNERLKRMESNQVVLEEKVDQNSRQTLLLAKKMQMSQAMLEGRIERVQEGNNVALAEARATRYEQEKLREETREFSHKWFAGITRVEEHQRVLQASVNGVAGTATVIDEGVQELDGGQETLQKDMAANHADAQAGFARVQQGQSDLRHAATEAFASLEKGQRGILTVSSQGVAATRGVSSQVVGVQTSLDDQTDLMQTNHTLLIAKVDDVTARQGQLQRSTNQQAQRLSKQVASVQTDLQEAHDAQNALVTQRADAIDASLSTAVRNQRDLSEQIKGHHDMAVDMGEHVKAIETEQKRIHDAMQQGNETLGSAIETVSQDQKKLHETMRSVEATAVVTQKQTDSMASEQSQFYQLEDQRHDSVIKAMAGLESSQQTTQDTVVQIQGTTQDIAREASAIRTEQAQVDEGLQQEGAQIRQGLTQLERNQGQLQQSVDRVQKTANTIQQNTESNAEKTRTVGDQQAALQEGVAREGAQIRQRLAELQKNQDQTYRAVNNVQVTSDTVASNTTTLMEQQATLQRVTHQNQAQVVDTLDQMGASQKALSQKADTLKQGQDEIKTLVTESQSTVGEKIDAVSSQQNTLTGSVAGVAATTQAIARETKDLKQGQLSLNAEIQAGDADLSHQVRQVDGVQTTMNQAIKSGKVDLDRKLEAMAQTQAGLDDHLTDQKDMSLDMARQINALQQDQTKINLAINQKQKTWERQTRNLTQRVAKLEKSLGQVDTHVSSLQTNLVSQITELTQVLKVLQEQDAARRAQLANDMKAFSTTLKQIQMAQSSLAARVEQVDSNQKQQGRDFLKVLKKSQKQTGKNAPVPPEETELNEVDVVK